MAYRRKNQVDYATAKAAAGVNPNNAVTSNTFQKSEQEKYHSYVARDIESGDHRIRNRPLHVPMMWTPSLHYRAWGVFLKRQVYNRKHDSSRPRGGARRVTLQTLHQLTPFIVASVSSGLASCDRFGDRSSSRLTLTFIDCYRSRTAHSPAYSRPVHFNP